MFLGILMIVAALIVVYFESKMREQNHKISSMLSIVSSVAEELNSVRGAINFVGGSYPNTSTSQNFSTSISPSIIELNSSSSSSSNNFETIKKMDLIEVSDGEESEEDESDDEDDSDDESDDESDDDLDEDLNIEDLNIDLTNESNDIKVLKLDIGTTKKELEDIDEDLGDENDIEEGDLDFDDNESIVSIDATTKDDNDIKVANFDLKSISIDSNLEEKEEKEPNYKKMSANKLKNIAVEKGLIKASSKLTKQEMLKLFH
jgi:hypothetical protein